MSSSSVAEFAAHLARSGGSRPGQSSYRTKNGTMMYKFDSTASQQMSRIELVLIALTVGVYIFFIVKFFSWCFGKVRNAHLDQSKKRSGQYTTLPPSSLPVNGKQYNADSAAPSDFSGTLELGSPAKTANQALQDDSMSDFSTKMVDETSVVSNRLQYKPSVMSKKTSFATATSGVPMQHTDSQRRKNLMSKVRCSELAGTRAPVHQRSFDSDLQGSGSDANQQNNNTSTKDYNQGSDEDDDDRKPTDIGNIFKVAHERLQ